MYFNSEKDLEKYYNDNVGSLIGAVVFYESPTLELTNFTYAIRFNASYLPLPKDDQSSSSNPFGTVFQLFSDSSIYRSSGFLTLQQAVDATILEAVAELGLNSTIQTTVQTQEFPRPKGKQDTSGFVAYLYSGIFAMAFIPMALIALSQIVTEKSERIRETLKLMGLKDSAYWGSWWIILIIPTLWFVVAMMGAGVLLKVFTHSDLSLVFVAHAVFGLTVIAFIFLVGAVCDSSKVAMVLGVLWLYVISGLGFYMTNVSVQTKYFIGLVAPLAWAFGSAEIIIGEGSGRGVHWNSINHVKNADTDMGLGTSIVIMLFDSFLYLLLAWYLSNVFPGQYGTPRKFYFPFQPSFWCPSSARKRDLKRGVKFGGEDESLLSKGRRITVDETAFEKIQQETVDEACKDGLVIQNLTKIFNTEHGPAVDNLNLELVSKTFWLVFFFFFFFFFFVVIGINFGT